ncbi:MAG: radical SAM protein [Elusimicrobia bacterium]|nr:radical SAM protein [Elusimicrobiota bacterium]
MSDTYERYALGLIRGPRRSERGPGRKRSPAGRRPSPPASLLARLEALSVKGWPERATLYTRSLPPGCVHCLDGRGSSISLTTLCNRDCFFCFNPRPRADVVSVHGRDVRSHAQAGRLLESLGVRSAGISGGEPLLFPARTLGLVKELRRRLPKLWIDVYTNGDLLTPRLLARLKAAGVDSLRLNLAANGYDPRPVRGALAVFPDLAVEMPVVPSDQGRLSALMGRLDGLGVRHLILHELFCSGHNAGLLRKAGCRTRARPRAFLTWSGVAASEASALRLVAEALEKKLRLSVYYCSTGTQQWIARKAWQT